MAKPNTAVKQTPSNVAPFQKRDKADAWLNIKIKTKAGEKPVGSIPLSLAKEVHAKMIEHEESIEKFQFVIEMKVVDPNAEVELEL